jgi:hypothetical protein
MVEKRTMSKAKVIEIVRRAGYPPAMVDEIASQLPDPVDLDDPILLHYGLTRDHLIDRLGGSP